MAVIATSAGDVPQRGYYTREKLEAMKSNLQQYAWARQRRDGVINRANKWLAYTDERLRTMVPPPEVPRAVVAHVAGAPVNGEALNKIGRYSWIIDFDRPWKIKSPVDGTVYPSNDFEAFVKSDFKDRSLLTGEYADDGWGCEVEGFEKPFWFAAVYAHWLTKRILLPALDDLSQAYLITDDARYAHACTVLLWQLADYYPRYFYENQSRYAKEVQKGYHGRLLYHTWECFTVQSVAPAYDAIWPAIDADEAIEKMTGQTADEIRRHIEDRLLRTMATDIMDGSGRIGGNYGMHQSGLLRIAAALTHSRGKPSRQDMIDWVLQNTEAKIYTQIGMEDAVNNLLHRDGHPFESASYSSYWIVELSDMVELLGDAGQRMIAMPRFRKLFEWPIRMACAGDFVPSYGDSNHMFHGLLGWTAECFEPAYRWYKAPIFARALIQAKARRGQDLFRRPIDDDELAKAAEKHPEPLGITSELLPGVGFASLQTGGDSNRTALAMFYGLYWGHAHYDRLQLDLYAWGHPMTPDFGYPETADSYDPRRFGFLAHTVAHNTVMIDAKRQAGPRADSSFERPSPRGRLHVFDPGRSVQLLEVSAEASYPATADLYRRTLMLVDVSPEQAYVVDIFRVRGGRQHDWIVHGTQAELKSDLPFSEPRKKGTLAGPDVPYGYFYDDRRYDDDNKAHVPYHLYEGSAFQWLFNVQEARHDGSGYVAWHLNRPEKLFPNRACKDVVLRAHLVGRDETVFACDGVPQRRATWPESVKFVVRRRAGPDLESVFLTVFEPYKRAPFIKSVRALPVDAGDDLPVAIEIDLGNRKHLLFNRLESAGGKRSLLRCDSSTVDARAVLLERANGGKIIERYVLDAGTSTAAKVQEVDYRRGRVTLRRPILHDRPAGNVAVVESEGHANAVPVIGIVDPTTFNVGDNELSAGTIHIATVEDTRVTFLPKFVYFIEPGMTVVDETGHVVGRLKSVGTSTAELETAPGAAAFPDLDNDGRRTCHITVIGPGDTVNIHTSRRTED